MAALRTLWLVVARSGSKGLPDKNILPVGGMPLLAWRIRSALHLPGEVWLSTDSERYAAIGESCGARVPFLRPAELSGDTASSVDVCLHAMEYAASNAMHFDVVCLLQPTSPFVRASSLQRGLDALASDPDAHGAVAVRLAHPGSVLMQPERRYLDVLAERFAALGSVRRQDLPREITPSGGFYFARWEQLRQTRALFAATTIPVLLEGDETLDIDTEREMLFADLIATRFSLARDVFSLAGHRNT